MKRVLNYFRRMKFLLRFSRSLPFFREFFLTKQISVKKKLIGVALIVGYALFPYDLIPDFLLGIGILDDVFVATLVLNWFMKLAPEQLKTKYQLIEKKDDSSENPRIN